MADLCSDHAITKQDESLTSLPFDLDEALSFPVRYSSDDDSPVEGTPTEPDWHPVVMNFPAVDPDDSAGHCTVCMEGFRSSGEGGRRMPCGHAYHASCITTWLSLGHSCPLCRKTTRAMETFQSLS